jgi:DNA-binding beta-propeller fold protein YncE
VKTLNLFSAHFAALLLCSLLSFVSSTFAATNPLNSPQGLALDAKGNLYVANNTTSQVLVFTPGYALVTSKTVTANVANPVSVAIDSVGNLYVANAGSNTVTEYNPGGTQIHTVYSSEVPYTVAVDGIGDVWVEVDYATVNLYPQYASTPLLSLSNPTDAYTGIAMYQGFAVLGTNTGSQIWEIPTTLFGQRAYGNLPETGFVMAFDTAGNLYSGNIDGTLSVTAGIYGGTTTLANLGFFPFGIAVDSSRNRIYVADANHNKIDVYNFSGALLHIIK